MVHEPLCVPWGYCHGGQNGRGLKCKCCHLYTLMLQFRTEFYVNPDERSEIKCRWRQEERVTEWQKERDGRERVKWGTLWQVILWTLPLTFTNQAEIIILIDIQLDSLFHISSLCRSRPLSIQIYRWNTFFVQAKRWIDNAREEWSQFWLMSLTA